MNYTKILAFVVALLKFLIPWINDTKWRKFGSVLALLAAAGGAWLAVAPATLPEPPAEVMPAEVLPEPLDLEVIESLDLGPLEAEVLEVQDLVERVETKVLAIDPQAFSLTPQ